MECTRKRTKKELSFMHMRLLLDLIHVPPIYYQIISDSMASYSPHKIFGFRGDKYITKGESCLSCTQHAYCSLSMPLPNIMKIFQTFKKLRSAQEFGLEIYSTRKRTKHMTLLHDLIYIPIKYRQIISHSTGVMGCTRVLLPGT